MSGSQSGSAGCSTGLSIQSGLLNLCPFVGRVRVNQRPARLEVGTQCPGGLGIELIVINTERFTTAVQLVDIGTGFHQHAGYLHTRLGVILLPGRYIE